jgi:hypothetical protein
MGRCYPITILKALPESLKVVVNDVYASREDEVRNAPVS